MNIIAVIYHLFVIIYLSLMLQLEMCSGASPKETSIVPLELYTDDLKVG